MADPLRNSTKRARIDTDAGLQSPSPFRVSLSARASLRVAWLTLLARKAEGGLSFGSGSSSSASSACCIEAVLKDPLDRTTSLGAREGLPRSLASVYGALAALFLSGPPRFRGECVASQPYDGPPLTCVVPTQDGLGYLATSAAESNVYELHGHGGLKRALGHGRGCGQLQFKGPQQIFVAADGFVFIAEEINGRVHVLTPAYDFHEFLCLRTLLAPSASAHGVVATDTTVFVSSTVLGTHNVFALDRATGAVLYAFGSTMNDPWGMCIMPKSGLLAVSHSAGRCVSLFSIKESGKRVGGSYRVKYCRRGNFVSSTWNDDLIVVLGSSMYEILDACSVDVFDASFKSYASCSVPGFLCAAVVEPATGHILVFTTNEIVKYA